MINHRHIFWQLISLNNSRIKGIQDNYIVFLGGIGKVGPIKPISMLVLLLDTLDHSLSRVFLVAFIKVDGVTINALSQLDHCFEEPFFLTFSRLYDGVKDLKDAWLYTPHDRGVEILVI
jgi:hypothetical protein